jgi:hypothetical protein
MYEKCADIDHQVELYRKLSLAVYDQATLERIKSALADLQAEKATLHPDQDN